MTAIKAELAFPPSTEMSEYRTQILAVQHSANELRIETESDREGAEALLRMVADGEKLITSRKEEITRPLMQALASGRDLFKPLELGFADAKKVIKSKILAYHIESHEKELALQAQIEARVAKGTMRADTAVAKLEKIQKEDSNVRTLRKVRVLDVTLVPREWMVPDMTLITKAVIQEGVTIPGVEIYEEKTIAVRRSV
jgi:hypothetical protein